jgi:hypothetical protein
MDTVLSGTAIYEEHQSFWVLNVIVILFAIGLVLAVVLTGANPAAMKPEDLYSTLGALGLAAFALWGFSRLNLMVSTTEFRFGFPIWHRRVAVSRIQVGEITRIPLWYGIGLHFVGGMWVYNARLGRGVMVVIGGRRYLIGSEHPEQLQAALLQVAPRRSNP